MGLNNNWRFGVVGNIVSRRTDENGNVYYGTKAFTSNTKVYINGKHWNCEQEKISVIGKNRFGRIVVESIPINLIENFRTQKIYKPCVLKIIENLYAVDGWEWWGRTVKDKKDTENFVQMIKQIK